MIARPPGEKDVSYSLGRERLVIRPGVGVHPLDAVVRQALQILPPVAGRAVLDLGCGCGVYGLAAARLGADRVVLTDLDPRALRAARANARTNGITGLAFRCGDFFQPVGEERFDLILASLPQTPAPRPIVASRWGGRDGLRHLRRLLVEAPRRLNPGGTLFFLLHDLADSARVERLARHRFRLRTAMILRRSFSPRELEAYLPGLFAYLDRRRRAGKARFHGRGARRWFRLRFLEAVLKS